MVVDSFTNMDHAMSHRSTASNRGHLPGDEMIYLLIYLYVAGAIMSLYDVITEDDSPDMLTLGASLLWPVMLPIALIWPLK